MSFAASQGVASPSSSSGSSDRGGGGGSFWGSDSGGGGGGSFWGGDSDWVPDDQYHFQQDWGFLPGETSTPAEGEEQAFSAGSFGDFATTARSTTSPTATSAQAQPASFEDFVRAPRETSSTAAAADEPEVPLTPEEQLAADWIPPDDPKNLFYGLSFREATTLLQQMEAEWADPQLDPVRRAKLAPYIDPDYLADVEDTLSETIEGLVAAEGNGTTWIPSSQADQLYLVQGIVLLEQLGTVDPDMAEQAEVLKANLAGRIDDSIWTAVGMEPPEEPEGPSRFAKVAGAILAGTDQVTGGASTKLLEWADIGSQHVLKAIKLSGKDLETGEDLGNGFGDTAQGVWQGLKALANFDDDLEQIPGYEGDGRVINFRDALSGDPNAGGRWAGLADTIAVIATDPFSWVTFGTAAKARVGLDAVEATFGRSVMQQVKRYGIKALDEGQQQVLRRTLTELGQGAIEAGGKRAAKLGAEGVADASMSALAKGGRQGVKFGGATVLPTARVTAPVSRALSETVQSTPVLSSAAQAASTVRRAVSPRARTRAVLGHFKERQLYRAQSLADAEASNQITDMSVRVNATRAMATKRRGVRRAEITDLELDRMYREMDTFEDFGVQIQAAAKAGKRNLARHLTIYRDYALLAAMPPDIMEYVDVLRQVPGKLDDIGRQQAIDELVARYPLPRKQYEDILDRDYWVPGMNQPEWEQAFRESGELEDFLDNADDVMVRAADNGDSIPLSEAWHTGRLADEDYFRFRNEVRSNYRQRAEFAGSLDGVDPTRLPPELQGSPGVDEAQDMFNQLDLLQYGRDVDAYNRKWAPQRAGDEAQVGPNPPVPARRPTPPELREKQTTNFPAEDLVGEPTSRVVREWTEDAPSDAALEGAVRRAENALPVEPVFDEPVLRPRERTDLDPALDVSNRPDPARLRELTEQGRMLRDSGRLTKQEWIDFNASGTLDELNEIAREQFGGMGVTDNIFVDDPLQVLAVQGRRQYKAAAEQKFVNTLVEDGFIAPVAKADSSVTQPSILALEDTPPAWFSDRYDGQVTQVSMQGQKYWVPTQIKDDLIKTDLLFNQNKEMTAFGKTMDRISSTWASWATGAFPKISFHTRNAYGNVYLNWIKGVRDPRVYVEAGRVQRFSKKVHNHMEETGRSFEESLGVLAAKGSKSEKRYARLLRSAREEGILTSSYFDELGNFEFDDLYRKPDTKLPRPGQGRIIGRNALPVRIGRDLGSMVEHNARLAHFISKLDELGDVRSAALSVKEGLFDYNDLTRFERTKLRTISRFYTFMRKNFGTHLQVLLNNPMELVNATRLTEAILGDDEGNVSQLGLPDWQKDAGYIVGGPSILNDVVSFGGLWDPGLDDASFKVDLPMTAAASMLHPVIQAMNIIPGLKDLIPGEAEGGDLASSLMNLTSGPAVEAVKLAFEHIMGVDSFTGAPLDNKGLEQHMMDLADTIAPVWSYYDRQAGNFTANDGLGPLGNNTASREEMEFGHSMLAALAGISVYGMGEGNNGQILKGYVRMYDDLVDEYEEEKGIKLPSFSELQQEGVLPEVRAVPEEGAAPREDPLDAQAARLDQFRELGLDVPDSTLADFEERRLARDTYTPTAEVRLWARRNGFEVSTSGRIPYEVQYAFNQANRERPYLDPWADLVRFSEDDTRESILD